VKYAIHKVDILVAINPILFSPKVIDLILIIKHAISCFCNKNLQLIIVKNLIFGTKLPDLFII
jgi:hypothetical protein